jgi:hypothetical protein
MLPHKVAKEAPTKRAPMPHRLTRRTSLQVLRALVVVARIFCRSGTALLRVGVRLGELPLGEGGNVRAGSTVPSIFDRACPQVPQNMLVGGLTLPQLAQFEPPTVVPLLSVMPDPDDHDEPEIRPGVHRPRC